jgi:hypothetical protein
VGFFRTDIGRFGKRLLAGEEPELSLRILSRIPNSKIVYDPSAVVYHRVNKNRANIRYVWTRSFYEGISKALITGTGDDAQGSLSSEDSYLRYLVKSAIPSRLKRLYDPSKTSQILALLLSMGAVFAGFVVGGIWKSNNKQVAGSYVTAKKQNSRKVSFEK